MVHFDIIKQLTFKVDQGIQGAVAMFTSVT